MTELENIILFFNERRLRCLSVAAIEREAQLPVRSLKSFLEGRIYRYLTSEQLDRLVPVLVDFGYKPIGDQFL